MRASTAAAGLADAIRDQAVRAGADTPLVRGADWQTVTVTAVNSDGTVNVGVIVARRLDSYASPQVGDIIYLSSSGAGNWIALGRAAVAGSPGFIAQTAITANITFAATETAIITTGSIVWRNGRAYRVAIWGLAGAATDSYALLRLRKTNASGTVWKDQMRINSLQASGGAGAVSLQTILTNTSGADITAPLCLTGAQGAVAQTWTWTASSSAVSYLLVEDIGPTSLYSGQAIT